MLDIVICKLELKLKLILVWLYVFLYVLYLYVCENVCDWVKIGFGFNFDLYIIVFSVSCFKW